MSNVTRTRQTSRLVSSNNLYLDSSNNIGIGTTVANSTLEVAGTITATEFNNTSDFTLKDDVKTIENPLELAESLRGVSFTWKSDSTRSIGVIAQEVAEILPELVHGDAIKTVNYNGIIGILIECVKELKKEVDSLKSQLDK